MHVDLLDGIFGAESLALDTSLVRRGILGLLSRGAAAATTWRGRRRLGKDGALSRGTVMVIPIIMMLLPVAGC